ncbi:hypothetical protein AB6A40_007608 [Gnathostoma spinigerum]|uniref:Nucleoporin Nup133/Nup155-like N-terminal domain-containing protein n=1 Tax=Gnathostoma spinigerum TaxID=75299 RepID=A0ABD6EUD9_9BILA
MMNGRVTPAKYEPLEAASNTLLRCMRMDYEFADLLYKLKFDRNQPDKVTISGLANDDYPSLRDLDITEFVAEHVRPIPQEVKDQLNNAQSIYTVGVLPEIGRAYMTIDSELFIWNFEENSDLAYFDGIPNVITKVAIARPKRGVFQEHIHDLLVVATVKDILLLAVTFTNSNNVTLAIGSDHDPRTAEMYLLPDTLFTIPLDGNMVSDIVATSDGRIFYAEGESIYELDYREKGWFQRRCRKINHSKGFINYIIPSLSVITGRQG